MEDKEEWEKIEEDIKIKDSEVIGKYGMDITKMRKRSNDKRRKEIKR